MLFCWNLGCCIWGSITILEMEKGYRSTVTSRVGSRPPLHGLSAGTNCCACMRYAHEDRILIHTLDRLLCPVRTISWIPRFSKRLRANVKTTMGRAGRFTRGRGAAMFAEDPTIIGGLPLLPLSMLNLGSHHARHPIQRGAIPRNLESTGTVVSRLEPR